MLEAYLSLPQESNEFEEVNTYDATDDTDSDIDMTSISMISLEKSVVSKDIDNLDDRHEISDDYEGEDEGGSSSDDNAQTRLRRNIERKKLNRRRKSRLSKKLAGTIRKKMNEWDLCSEEELDVLNSAMSRLGAMLKPVKETPLKHGRWYGNFGMKKILYRLMFPDHQNYVVMEEQILM